MEVILREDVDKVGARGALVKVADGYARNFLLPKRLAVPATDANKKIVDQEREAYLRREAKDRSESEDLAKLLTGVTLTFRQKVGENNHLFGSVTAKDIADALEAEVPGRAPQGAARGTDSHGGRPRCRGAAASRCNDAHQSRGRARITSRLILELVPQP